MSTITFTPAFDTRPAPQAPQAQDHQSREQRAGGEVRLTRRGRLAVFLASLAFVLGASFFLGAGAVGTDEAQPTEVVMVGSGETLWGIAAAHAGDSDVRDVMSQIEELNALETPVLQAGQRLVVPVQADE